ncbi:MAG: hypothetical protein M0020_10890 [Actinomycetota bacterium]|nr:hypothetical protein [Actinomycetota bacterium]
MADEPGSGTGPHGGNVVVHVTFEPGDPPSGSATTDLDAPGLAFSGWLSFVEALDVLRRGANRAVADP